MTFLIHHGATENNSYQSFVIITPNGHSALYWFGFSLTILGICSTALGVFLTRREYTKLPGVLGRSKRVAIFIRKKLSRKPGPVVVASAGAAIGTLSASATARIKPPTNTDSEKIEWLLIETRDIWDRLGQVDQRMHEESEERRRSDVEEQTARIDGETRLSGKIEGLAGNSLRISAFGVLLLLIGQFLMAFWS